MELALGVIALAVIAILVGALNRHDDETELGKEIRAERTPVANTVNDAGNGLLVWGGLALLIFVLIVLASGG